MIKALDYLNQNLTFRADAESADSAKSETRVLPNNPKTRAKQKFQKTSSAIIDYPAKGLKGDVNSNFYEFLSMGIIPYLAGSATLMLVFNVVNRFLSANSQKAASKIVNKLALGVVLYGLLKNISKPLITTPVKMATGIDVEMPYENVVYSLPTEAGKDAEIKTQYQQRKVFDSKEFYRKDLLDKSYFDKIAKKMGLGENLNDSETEVSPIIQNVVATTSTAKSLSSFSCAALGVMLATQDSWDEFFDSFKKKERFVSQPNESFLSKCGRRLSVFGKNTVKITKQFGKSLLKSCKTLWTGKEGKSGFPKHAGKIFILFTGALTTFLTANSIIRAKNMAKYKNKETINENKRFVEI